jgi:hypothetical protein
VVERVLLLQHVVVLALGLRAATQQAWAGHSLLPVAGWHHHHHSSCIRQGYMEPRTAT